MVEFSTNYRAALGMDVLRSTGVKNDLGAVAAIFPRKASPLRISSMAARFIFGQFVVVI